MEKTLRDKILGSFPNSSYLGVVYEYNTGRSGSPVFAVHYKPKNRYGLDGTFIVKIGAEEWAEKEQELYDSLSASAPPLLTQGIMHTPPFEGLSAVAYEVAFNALIEPKTLMNILDEGKERQEKVQQQIKELVQALVDWYIANRRPVVKKPYDLLAHMLTERRTRDLLQRMQTTLPFWKADVSHIIVQGLERLLPNPLAFEAICEKISHNPSCPLVRIHGDLHTGNIICFLESQQIPKVIDFEQSVPDGVPFFDLAYLEFDMTRHLLSVEQRKGRQDWLALLNASMTDIQGSQRIDSWSAERAWTFLEPIRQEVSRLQQVGGEDYEVVWWLSTVAAGLNFARKGDHTRSLFERMAGLLYAAYGLDRLLKMFNVQESAIQKATSFPSIPWLSGDFPPQASSEPPARETIQATPATLTADSSETAPAQTHQFLPSAREQTPDLTLASEPTENNPHPSVAELPTQGVEPTEEKKTDKDKRLVEANKIQQWLQEAVTTFQRGGLIYKDMCNSTDQLLQQLETFLQELDQDIPVYDYFNRFSQGNLLDLKRNLHADLQSFRESCPPAPARKLSQERYDEECAAISNSLENIQTKFLALCKTLP
ncbi:MAG TPA: phosphotransferase [Ktedonobacteraceae bacterium]|nr:phosphotransferase [Ktedonobacteraceae bacterium]